MKLNLTPEQLRKLSRKELTERKQQLATELRSQGDAYEARRKKNGDPWPEDTRQKWDSTNKAYDENEKALIENVNDDEVRNRVQQIRQDEEQSQRTGHRPGLDDTIPGTRDSYGDRGFTRDQATEYAQSQADKRTAFRCWLASGKGSNFRISEKEIEACQRVGMEYNAGSQTVRFRETSALQNVQRRMRYRSAESRQNMVSPESRALSFETAGAGPELVPQTFIGMLETAMLAYGDMLSYVEILTTDGAEEIKWPHADDTSNEGTWVGTEGEDTQAAGEPNPALRDLRWTAHELHSKWIKVPLRLYNGTMIDLESVIATMLGTRIGRALNRSATLGNGTRQATGIIPGSPVGITAAAAAAISYDDIVKLEHSVDNSYRAESSFMFHDSILESLRLLKDTQGRPLWQSSMTDGVPDRLHGRPYVYNNHMADTIATGNLTMGFGRLSDYKLRVVQNVQILKATERFIENLEHGYLAYLQADGKLLRPTADLPTPFKTLQQA